MRFVIGDGPPDGSVVLRKQQAGEQQQGNQRIRFHLKAFTLQRNGLNVKLMLATGYALFIKKALSGQHVALPQ